MHDGRAILNQIIEEPEENTHRLVYADWLEETGEPANEARAHFIRAQVELSILRAGSEPRSRDQIAKIAEQEKIARAAEQPHWECWVGELVAGLKWWNWDRGFVGWAGISPSAYLRDGPRLHRATPLCRVDFAGRQGIDLGRLARRKCFRHLRDVTVYHSNRATGFERFADSSHVRLRHLRINGGGPCVADIQRVAESAWAPGLETLRLRQVPNPVPGTLGAALGAPSLSALRNLWLEWTLLGQDDIAAFGAARDGKPLEQLQLYSVGLAQDGLRALVRTPLFRQGIAHLGFHRNALNDAAVTELVEAPGFERTVTLDLTNNQFGDAGARALAASPRVAGLRQLLAWGNRLSPRGQHTLRTRFGDRVHVRLTRRCEALEEWPV